MPILQREVFTGSQCLIPELDFLGYNNQHHARIPGLLKHTHEEAFEIFWIERGEVEWWTAQEVHHVKAGQIYINRPGEQHGSVGPASQPSSYFWLQLKSGSENMAGLSQEESSHILNVLSNCKPRCFEVSEGIQAHYQALLDEARTPNQLSASVMRAHLHLLLAQVIRESAQITGREFSAPIRAALDFIKTHLESPLPLSELAQQAGLSTSHFRHRFRAEVGFTPHAYLTRQRVEAAKSLLRSSDLTILNISQQLGFNSSQHFATVFKKLEGISPSDYTHKWGQASSDFETVKSANTPLNRASSAALAGSGAG